MSGIHGNLEIRNISKKYANGVRALDDISLTIPSGMFGLLGPNGAGKSTLMRILATLQEPDEGSITFRGIDVIRQKNDLKKTLGYLPQEFGVYPKISAEKLLDYFAVLKGITSPKERSELIPALLKKTNLWEVRKQKLGSFSGGMKQRFGIAIALIGNPGLLIVDEPTAGLDPYERLRFLNLLCELGENSVVILSTHIVEDVAELCTSMAIILKGRILLENNPMRSVREIKGMVWSRCIGPGELPTIERNYKVISTKLVAGQRIVHVYSTTCPGPGFESVDPDLKDVYFSAINGFIGENRDQHANALCQ